MYEKGKRNLKRTKKSRKKSDDLTGFVPLFRKKFQGIFQAQIYFSRACSLFLPGLSGSGKCQNKIAGLSRFSRPFRALSDKMSIMKLVNFSPFLESFFPGGGGETRSLKSQTDIQMIYSGFQLAKLYPNFPRFSLRCD